MELAQFSLLLLPQPLPLFLPQEHVVKQFDDPVEAGAGEYFLHHHDALAELLLGGVPLLEAGTFGSVGGLELEVV